MCIRDSLITLADFYGVSVDYLLCRTENREQINTPLTELHLNDEMVAFLKSGRINNRLLCELATHKDFIKFLADIEIYVPSLAGNRFWSIKPRAHTKTVSRAMRNFMSAKMCIRDRDTLIAQWGEEASQKCKTNYKLQNKTAKFSELTLQCQ